MSKKRRLLPTLSRKFLLPGISVLFVILLGFFVYRSLIRPSTIALIAEPAPKCQSLIASFSTSGYCGNGYVKQVTYTCSDPSRKGTEGGVNQCIDPAVAFKHAQDYCGQICEVSTPTPTPTPAPSCVPNQCKGEVCKLEPLPSGQVYCAAVRDFDLPKPSPVGSTPARYSPTPVPSPSQSPTADPNAKPITCNIDIYKIPQSETGDTSQGSTLGYFKPEYLVTDHKSLLVRPGDVLAYSVTLINDNSYAVGNGYELRSTNYNGTVEPVASVVAMGGTCSLTPYDNMKTVSCKSDFPIPPKSSAVANASIVIKYNSATTPNGVVGTTFFGQFGSQNISCPMKALKFNETGTVSSTPNPAITTVSTPTPTSIAKPSFMSCYRSCRTTKRSLTQCVRGCLTR